MSRRGAENFLQEFSGWGIVEWMPPAGASISEAAAQACAAIQLGAGVVSFRFNGITLTVETGDTVESVLADYNDQLAARVGK